MHGAVLFESLADVHDIKADEVADLDIGDLALRLHLAKPSQGRPALIVEEEFEQAFCADELWWVGGDCFHGIY